MFKWIGYILFLGLALFCLFVIYAFKRLSQKGAFNALFKEFNRKMWMTFCLGGTFFGLYILIVNLSVYFVRPWGTDLLFLVHQHPISFIYLGLWLFACLSLLIYLVRMLIKYIYLTRGKDR